MEIPLEKKLKKRLHVQVGRLQDEVTETAYGVDPQLVLHGGTAIWRCFSGNRFSEDLDFYCTSPKKMADGLREALSARSLALVKFKSTANLIFAKISDGEAEVRLEMNIAKKVPSEVRRYERMNGSALDVFCPSLPALILEKAAAYQNRRFVRDLYDIHHLTQRLEAGNDDIAVSDAIHKLLSGFRKPLDADNLPALVYSGAAPSTGQMLLALRRRF